MKYFLLSLIFFSSICFAKQPTVLILPVGPGGLVHKYVLEMQPFFNEFFGNIIIDFKPGAEGSIGASALAENKTEKITLMMGPVQNWPTNPLRDLTPVAYMGTIPGVIFTNSKSNYRSFKEVLEKSQTDVISYGFPGTSNNGKLIRSIVDTHTKSRNFIEVPYKSGTAVTNDVIGNHIVLGVSIPNNIYQHVKSNTLIPLVTFGPSRSRYLPDIPTLSELNLSVEREYRFYNNVFLFANKNANKQELHKLRVALKQYFESEASINVRKTMDIHFGTHSILSPEKLINDIISQ
jgi:tripartite-type tricarboxylate transporter receptor subunit TctC